MLGRVNVAIVATVAMVEMITMVALNTTDIMVRTPVSDQISFELKTCNPCRGTARESRRVITCSPRGSMCHNICWKVKPSELLQPHHEATKYQSATLCVT